MKKLLAVLIVCIFASATIAGAAETKVGFVDLQKALQVSAAGMAAKEKIGQKVKEYQSVMAAREEELRTLKEELDKQALLLSEESRATKERDFQAKVKDYQRFKKDVQEELQQKDADFTRKILEELLGVIREVGEKGGYTVVLEKNESSILYADSNINLTDQVVEAYDRQYQQAKAK